MSNSSELNFYFSTNNTLSKTNDKLLKSVTIPALNTNALHNIKTKVNGWDIFTTPENSSNNGNYYLIIELDANNSNNEGSLGETNNILAISFSYNSSATASSKLRILLKEKHLQPYYINVYNFQGQKVMTNQVKNIEEENKATLSLPKGIYIIKSKNRDRKVFNN